MAEQNETETPKPQSAPKAASAKSSGEIVATLHSPSVHRFQVRAGGDTYVITRGGTTIPAEHADTIQKAALNSRLVVNVTAKD